MTSRRKPELNTALTEAVREFGSPTTPQQLEERGVLRVRYVSLEQVSAMIEKAINRTIMERTIGGVDGDMGLLVDQAQAGLLGLLKGVEEVEASRDAIGRSRTELLAELTEMRRERVRASATPPADPNDPTVQKMLVAIRDTFVKLGGMLGPLTPEAKAIEREFTERALILLEETRRRAAAAQIRERDDHVDRLERRVRKLVQSLEATETALKDVAAMKNIDLGIASLYRVVQGLSPNELNRNLKKEMMEMIFKANLELQKKRAAST
jgi:hypothetical protein